jgi:hypothetical protein
VAWFSTVPAAVRVVQNKATPTSGGLSAFLASRAGLRSRQLFSVQRTTAVPSKVAIEFLSPERSQPNVPRFPFPSESLFVGCRLRRR